jgi:hypothetical protein
MKYKANFTNWASIILGSLFLTGGTKMDLPPHSYDFINFKRSMLLTISVLQLNQRFSTEGSFAATGDIGQCLEIHLVVTALDGSMLLESGG